MGSFSIWHWLIVLAVVLLLFGGGGKIPRLMKDVGSGIRNFRKGLSETDEQDEETADDKESPKLESKQEENLDAPSNSKKKSKAVNG